MENLFSTALGPIAVLWIGALVFYILDRFLIPQDRGTAEPVVLILASVFMLLSRGQIDVPLQFGAQAFEMAPTFVADETTWLLSLLLLGGMTMASLASIGEPPRGRAGRMAALGAALTFLVAGDWATMTLAWVLVDLGLTYALYTETEQSQSLSRVVPLSLGGAALLGAGTTIGQIAGDSIVTETPIVGSLFMLAAVLRVLPVPLPSWQDLVETGDDPDTRPAMRALVYVLPPVMGIVLWARLVAWIDLEGMRWLSLLPLWGGLALLAGAARAWSVADPDELVSTIGRYARALALVVVGAALPQGFLPLLAGSLVLGVCGLLVVWSQCQYLDIFDVRSYWRAMPMLIVLLSLAGVPPTVGFAARISIHSALYAGRRWFALLLWIGGEALFLGALLRVLFELECVPDMEDEDQESSPLSLPAGWPSWIHDLVRQAGVDEWREEMGYAAGTIVVLAVIALGLAPRTLSGTSLGGWFLIPTLPVWAGLLLPVVGALAAYRSRDRLLDLATDWWPLFERLRPGKGVAEGIERLLHYVGTFIWGGTLVVEGAGYMAWVLLVCLVIVLFAISR